MSTHHIHTTTQVRPPTDRPALADEAGEGVISAAIAVLIMAFLGVAMWVGFSAIMDDATEQVGSQVEQIGG